MGGPLYFGYRANELFEDGLNSAISGFDNTYASTFALSAKISATPDGISNVLATHLNLYAKTMLNTILNSTDYQNTTTSSISSINNLNATIVSVISLGIGLQDQINQLKQFSTTFNSSNYILISNYF